MGDKNKQEISDLLQVTRVRAEDTRTKNRRDVALAAILGLESKIRTGEAEITQNEDGSIRVNMPGVDAMVCIMEAVDCMGMSDTVGIAMAKPEDNGGPRKKMVREVNPTLRKNRMSAREKMATKKIISDSPLSLSDRKRIVVRLKSFRKNNPETGIEEIAKRVGTSTNSVYAWCSGRAIPTSTSAGNVLRFIEVNEDVLRFIGEGS